MSVTTPAVVDTDVVSFLLKSHPLAPAYQAILAGRSLAVSLITLAEIEYGMEAKNWGSNRRNLMHRFLGRFTVLSPDAETARLWAQIKRACEEGLSNHVFRRLGCSRGNAVERSSRNP